MEKHNTNAFTLIELIIVITIISVLALIAFLSFQKYSIYARDSDRLSTVKNVETGLNVYITKSGVYPEPDKSFMLVVNGESLGYQGYVGDNVSRKINFNQVPLDPSVAIPYVYRTNVAKTKYQILTYTEENF